MGDSSTGTGLWFTHSTPQFPFRRDQNLFWPDSGYTNAQTFMCVTLGYDDLKTVGRHLQNIRALVFDHDLPVDFHKELKDAVQKSPDTRSDSDHEKLQDLKTKDGKELKILAKKTGKTAEVGDLYVQLAEEFKSDMNAQTWDHNGQRDKSFCYIGYNVVNIKEVSTDVGVWINTKDHSKWAITTYETIHWTCIADNNRSPSQYERPGGALCIKDEQVKNYFEEFIKTTEDCPKRKRSHDSLGSLPSSFPKKKLN
ncbi:plancitoxin-1-like isoform X2 [Boleophthalmus pectinirostris]|nr:plancitoxin-1-like isoform X2 [Boleophthalmus pectinirostris]